jgi:predicted thioesterase
MIAFMEQTARLLLAEVLPPGLSSVGVMVHIRHLAPTPVGATVCTRVEVTSVDGSKVNFTMQAWDDQELIGSGEHQRVVVDEARFLRRVSAKSETL